VPTATTPAAPPVPEPERHTGPPLERKGLVGGEQHRGGEAQSGTDGEQPQEGALLPPEGERPRDHGGQPHEAGEQPQEGGLLPPEGEHQRHHGGQLHEGGEQQAGGESRQGEDEARSHGHEGRSQGGHGSGAARPGVVGVSGSTEPSARTSGGSGRKPGVLAPTGTGVYAGAPAASTSAAATSAPSTAPAASAPSTAPAPAPVATVAPVASSSPAVSSPAAGGDPRTPAHRGARHHVRRAHRTRHRAARHRARSRATHGRSQPASHTHAATAAATAAASRRAARAHVNRRPASQRDPRPARSTPLVTTITKIVNVVPPAVRLLLGLLVALALAFAARSRMAAVRARKLERQRAQLLEDVGLLQAALLPQTPAHVGGVAVSTAYRPAEGPGAGGDFYDVFVLESGALAAIVGDVSGHGRQALPHTALVRFTLRAYLEAGLSPRMAVQTAGAVLDRQLGDSFATVLAATYDPRERTLVYACAGHPPPVVLGRQAGRGGVVDTDQAREGERTPAAPEEIALLTPVTACGSPPIGVGMRTGLRQTTVALPGAARVCLHTDGVTEARTAGELYGTARLAGALSDLDGDASASRLLERVAATTDTRADDMAACVLNVAGGRGGPEAALEELEVDREAPSAERARQWLRHCGLRNEEAAELIAAARAAAGPSGTCVIAVGFDNGRPRASLRRDNVVPLPTVLAERRAEEGGARSLRATR